jgi:probable HAF family extracellular repeat protein
MIKTILSFSCIFWAALAVTAELPNYQIQDLGTLGGGESYVNGMNSSGHVVGSSLTRDSGFHAYLFYDGAMHDIGTLSGAQSSANAVNDTDEVVGKGEAADGSIHAFLYSRSSNSMLDLQSVFDNAGFGGTESTAVGINNLGQIVGGVTTASEDTHAFVWDRRNGTVRDLHAAVSFGGSNSKAFSISDGGRIVGASEDVSGNAIGFVYDLGSGTLVSLGSFGGATSEALGVNASGLVTGAADLSSTDAYHAYRSAGQSALTSTDDVGTLGGSQSVGFAVNDSGVVVGSATDARNQTFATIYDSTHGVRHLETLLPSNPGWILVHATAINNAGQIAGEGYINGDKHAFLMTVTSTPTPIPTLGNYLDTSISLSGEATVTPDTAPTNTTSINVSTSTNFKGKLEGNLTTGGVRVTDAHPAGTYTVTVKAFNGSNGPTTKTFTLTVTTPPACNPVSFANSTFEVGDRVGGALVGDFNADGKQDLAVAAVTASFSTHTLILLGDGVGHFNFVSDVPIGARAVADVNGDGKQDLVALDSNKAVIYSGDGTGHFSAASSVDTGCAAPFQLAVADFNGDGKLDLATACYFTNSVTVLLGDGAGGFGPASSFTVSAGPQGLAVGDFNGDGKQDLAVACITAGKASILLGNGAGAFAPAVDFNAGATPRDIEVGDFNDDGKQDLGVSNPSLNVASVLLGDGAGGFGAPTSFAVGIDPETIIAVGDFNADGSQDLAVPNFGSANVSILLGNGAGGFVTAVNFGVGLSPFGVVVGDFNGDGKQDLATANWGSNNVSILLRDCTNTPAGTNILVQPVDSTTGLLAPISVNFSQVTSGGMTNVTSDSNYSGQPLPSKFKLGNPPTYYDITTTAQYTPPVTVCVEYPNNAYQQDESNLRLMHFNGFAWENITTFIDIQANIVCGVTNSLSPFVVAEEDVQPPQFTVPANINTNATSSGGTLVTYITPVASDDFDGTVPVNCSPQSGSTFALGTTEVICTATDSAGNTKQKNFDVTVTYAWSGLLQPINADGSSIFKLGSTVPVKFALTDASAGVTNAVARLFYSKTNNNVVGTDLEATTTVSASTGNLFRYDTTTRQYMYNWSTKGLTTGTYQLKIDLVDGTTHTVSVSLK